MNSDAYKRTSNIDKSTLLFFQTWGDLGLTVMRELADLQFTFVSAQMESVYGQLDLLSNVRTINYFLPADTAYGTMDVNIFLKPAKLYAVPAKKPVIQADKRIKIVSAPRTKTVTRRKTRKKSS